MNTDGLEHESERAPILANSERGRSDERSKTVIVDDNAEDADTPMTVDDAVNLLGWGRFQYKVFVLCGMGNFVEAVELSMMSILFPVLKAYWKLQNWQIASVGAASVVGMLIGAVLLGRLSDRIGRRPVFQLSLFISSLFGILSAMSSNIFQFIVLRGMLGVGYGGNIVTDTVLLAELIPVRNRGWYMAFMDVFFGVGALVSVLIAWLVIPKYGWRTLVVICSIPAFLMLFFRRGVPESPRYLLLNKEDDGETNRSGPDEAKQVFLAIAEENNESEAVKEKLRTMQLKPVEVTHGESVDQSYAKLFTNPHLGRVTLLLVIIWGFDAFGASLYTWLPLYLSENTKLTHSKGIDDAYTSAIFMAVGSLCGSLILIQMIHRVDRRVLLRAGLGIMTVFTLGLLLFRDADTIIRLLPFISAVKDGTITMLYVYTPEMYPTEVRTTALGFCSAFHRGAPAVAHFTVALMLNFSFSFAFAFFSAVYFVAFVAAMLLSHDSRGQVLASFYIEAKESKE